MPIGRRGLFCPGCWSFKGVKEDVESCCTLLSHSAVSALDDMIEGFLQRGAAGALISGALIQVILMVGVG
jgi:hypothetical protein